ncbi:unnamed protein product, partial [Notodromas monacha]
MQGLISTMGSERPSSSLAHFFPLTGRENHDESKRKFSDAQLSEELSPLVNELISPTIAPSRVLKEKLPKGGSVDVEPVHLSLNSAFFKMPYNEHIPAGVQKNDTRIAEMAAIKSEWNRGLMMIETPRGLAREERNNPEHARRRPICLNFLQE